MYIHALEVATPLCSYKQVIPTLLAIAGTLGIILQELSAPALLLNRWQMSLSRALVSSVF